MQSGLCDSFENTAQVGGVGSGSWKKFQDKSRLLFDVTKVVTVVLILQCAGTRLTNEVSLQQNVNPRKTLMQVLSRKLGEKLVIDGDITLEIVRSHRKEKGPD